MNSGFLDQLLGSLDVFIVTALPFLRPDAFYLFNTFIILTIVFAGAWLAFGVPTHNVQFFIKKVLLIGFFSFLVNNWLPVTNTIIETFAKLGLKAAAAGGSGIAPGQFFSPSSIVDMGTTLARPFFSQVNTLWGLLESNGLSMVIAVLSAVIIILAFVVLALQVMITLIEFKLVTLAGFILLPFALFSKTTFLTERVIGYVFSAGLKLFVLAIIVTFCLSVVPGWSVSPEPDVEAAVAVMSASLLVMGLSLFAPSVASSLVTGGPSLGVGAAGGAALTAGSILAAGGLGVAGAVGAGRKGARNLAPSIERSRAAARIDNLAPMPGSQALRNPGRPPELPGQGSRASGANSSTSSGSSSSGAGNRSNSYAGQNRGRMASAGRALAGGVPRGGDGGGGLSADLKGE